MKKVAFIFIAAVFIPSLVLAYLALRSLRDQQYVLERQQALLYQGTANATAEKIRRQIPEVQREFEKRVEALLVDQDPRAIASTFDEKLRAQWPLANVGFAVSLDGNFLSPPLWAGAEARRFRRENEAFLSERAVAEVYPTTKNEWVYQQTLEQGVTYNDSATPEQNTVSEKDISSSLESVGKYAKKSKKSMSRSVIPQKEMQQNASINRSNVEEAEFRQLVSTANAGMLARFLENKLRLLLWYRSPRDPQLVFGSELRLSQLTEMLTPSLEVDYNLQEEICVALLDDTGKPVARTHPAFTADWRSPFVASEIGDVLPHWEVGVYLLNPRKLSESARALQLTFGFLIFSLVGAITLGGWLVVVDLRRQALLARQKSDFVSNVSHELKTPLTSIRMFAELLNEGRVTEQEKQRGYLKIICAEAARLTRLINNVLDFAKIERNEKKYRFETCSIADIVKEMAENYRPHLEASGYRLEVRIGDDLPPVSGDRDALSQVIVNLMSNAEKYGGKAKEIAIEAVRSPANGIEIRVMDRGAGVPVGARRRIFEKFYRAHDSLASGIQGSGLGLTLARQIASAHGGDVIYSPREGGGSIFTFHLP